MRFKFTVRFAYRALQVGLLCSFLAMLALLHARNLEMADHEQKVRLLDHLALDLEDQQEVANRLMSEARKSLAAAEAWNPAGEKDKEPPAAAQPPESR
jgi:hypothetical protein